jgi:hypothetical protein
MYFMTGVTSVIVFNVDHRMDISMPYSNDFEQGINYQLWSWNVTNGRHEWLDGTVRDSVQLMLQLISVAMIICRVLVC